MSKKYPWGVILLASALALTWVVGTAMTALAEPPEESWNFTLLGAVDVAVGNTNADLSRAYSKIAPWPDTEGTYLNTGCYENDVNRGTVGCFRVVDVVDPTNPVRVATVEVFDPSGDTTLTLVSVTSNEPDNGMDDGNTVDDIVIVDDFTFDLRAERSGVGTGRVYTITYHATDACGNTTVASATVTVPLEQ